MIFTRLNRASRPTSALAMAIALAAGGMLTATAIEAPAYAQRDKKKKKDKEQQAEYSKEFLAAYQPIADIQKEDAPDYAKAKSLIPAMLATVKSDDEKNAAGGMMFNLANDMGDDELQLQGIAMMIESGKLDAATQGQLSFAAYQTYRDMNDVANARASLENAIAANYSFNATMTDGSTQQFGPDRMRWLISDLYFDQGNYAEGLNYLSGLIEARKAEGGVVPEMWVRQGLAQAYENNLTRDAVKYAAFLVESYPSDVAWGDAVIITLNGNNYENPEVLDLLRLSRRTGVYNDQRVLSEYVEVLDPRRYPGEVVAVIDEGFASGVADKTDPYLIETRGEAAGRIAGDKADLPNLARDARSPSADMKTLVVAGDTFLSYDQPAEAEEFYTKALTMAGIDLPLVLTRLGIAQYDQGKYAEAIETFGKVEGARRDLANLWAIHSAQKGAM